ncbi:MAG: NAD-dependent epimerase/dehydratase family protein [Terriglobia bacterium]
MKTADFIIDPCELILVTGARGFIGARVVHTLHERGFRNVRCFTRRSTAPPVVEDAAGSNGCGSRCQIFQGNLLSREDCAAAAKGAAVIIHLAAGRGEKSFAGAFVNSVVATRNLLEACAGSATLKRFVNVSSFSVYTNSRKAHWRLLDESCPAESHPELRGDAYSFAKVKQDEIAAEYAKKFSIPCVTVRPGYVYGPGNLGITGRVGTSTFGVFLHLGGSNPVPFTYVDNCADAIVLAALKKGIDGEVFNVVDDDLPSSRRFLRLYKQNVRYFRSVYVPHALSYALCWAWERYSSWSEGQLPPVFNRREWHAYWKMTRYSNRKLKSRLGWSPAVPTAEGLRRYFAACREKERNA